MGHDNVTWITAVHGGIGLLRPRNTNDCPIFDRAPCSIHALVENVTMACSRTRGCSPKTAPLMFQSQCLLVVTCSGSPHFPTYPIPQPQLFPAISTHASLLENLPPSSRTQFRALPWLTVGPLRLSTAPPVPAPSLPLPSPHEFPSHRATRRTFGFCALRFRSDSLLLASSSRWATSAGLSLTVMVLIRVQG